ncbi:hypothetical protein HGRIS_010465 [Hohenbuehelia grisea]|uniref:Uncharacterized protein n=1 Tax=Hohenbuehelia grisea TaxID=104357 RepID=A0ABR3IZL7_9AGAR
MSDHNTPTQQPIDPMQQIADLTEQVAKLTRQMATVVPPPPPPEPTPQPTPLPTLPTTVPKIAEPEIFDGNRDKCTTFLPQVGLYISIRQHEFPTDTSKVALMISFLQGPRTGLCQQGMERDIEMGEWSDGSTTLRGNMDRVP